MLHRTAMVLLLAMLLPGTALAQAIVVGTDWQSVTTSTAQGNLDGITVEVTDIGVAGSAPLIDAFNLSGPEYDPFPLLADQECVDYSFDQDWTATFSEPVTDLLLYCKFWRGPNPGAPPTFRYEFDQPFTIVAGLGAATVSGNILQLPTGSFHDGILQFSGSISSLSQISNNANNSSRQALTFGFAFEVIDNESSSFGAVKSLYR
jgi:hypothetical protein